MRQKIKAAAKAAALIFPTYIRGRNLSLIHISKLVAAKQGKIQRIFNPKYPYEYIEGIEKVIKGKEGIREFYETEVF